MKVWLYARLSRDEDDEMNSLNNQRQIVREYAEKMDYEVVGESFDDNVSGMTFDRDGIRKIAEQVEENDRRGTRQGYVAAWQTQNRHGGVH